VILNDLEVEVTTNLEKALRHLRIEDKVRTIWIDALCINQGNISERNSQVKMMGEIYKSAAMVMIWLGEAADDSDFLLQFILHRHLQLDLGTDLGTHDSDPDETARETRRLGIAFENLLRRAWWKRIWIVQELALAKSDPIVVCGTMSIPWSVLSEYGVLQEIFQNADHFLSEPITNIGILQAIRSNVRDKTKSLHQPHSLQKLLRLTRYSLATDPRDKIYGLLGLVQGDDVSIMPDYGKQVSRLYLEIACHIISSERCLDILTWPHSRADLGLPSWAPNFAEQVIDKYHCCPLFLKGSQQADVPFYQAGKKLFKRNGELCYAPKSIVTFSEDLRTMMACGITFDIITDCVGPSQPETLCDFLDQVDRVDLKANASFESETDPKQRLLRKEQLWEVLAAGGGGRSKFNDEQDWKRWRQWLRTASHKRKEDQYISREFEEWGRLENINSACQGRSFFLTASGFFGIGPAETRPLDTIVILLGGPVPFVLRLLGGYHIMIGECYVGDIMQGEVINIAAEDMRREDEFKVFAFNIS